MKKLLFTFAILVQSVFVFANNDNNANTARVQAENVKVYRQPGTTAEVLKSLNNAEEVVVMRRHNSKWTIISVDGTVGYVQSSKISKSKAKK